MYGLCFRIEFFKALQALSKDKGEASVRDILEWIKSENSLKIDEIQERNLYARIYNNLVELHENGYLSRFSRKEHRNLETHYYQLTKKISFINVAEK